MRISIINVYPQVPFFALLLHCVYFWAPTHALCPTNLHYLIDPPSRHPWLPLSNRYDPWTPWSTLCYLVTKYLGLLGGSLYVSVATFRFRSRVRRTIHPVTQNTHSERHRDPNDILCVRVSLFNHGFQLDYANFAIRKNAIFVRSTPLHFTSILLRIIHVVISWYGKSDAGRFGPRCRWASSFLNHFMFIFALVALKVRIAVDRVSR